VSLGRYPPPKESLSVEFTALRAVRRTTKVMTKTVVMIAAATQRTGISSHQAELSDTAGR
jgi:hypothetical protein